MRHVTPRLVLLLVLVLVLGPGCTSLSQWYTTQDQDWKYVVDASGGPIRLGKPIVEKRDVRIPVLVEGPKNDSARMWKAVTTKVEGNEVRFSLSTCVVGPRKDPREIILYDLNPGLYTILYLDPDGATTHVVGRLEVAFRADLR